MGLSGKEKGAAQGGLRASPLPLVLLGLGEVAGPLLLFSRPRNPSWTRIGGGILLPEGVGLSCAPTLAGQPLLPCSFIYGGRGHPIDTTIDLLIS